MTSVEVLIRPGLNRQSEPMLHAMAAAISRAGDKVRCTLSYEGLADWLILYGIGAEKQTAARREHLRVRGRHCVNFDLGYFGPGGDRKGWMRCSVDHDHPQRWLDVTPPEPHRWKSLGIQLREDCDPHGHLLLIGLGRKSRVYLHEEKWELHEYARMREEHPNARVIYRPKPGNHPVPPIPNISIDNVTPIERLLVGCAGIYCRHSNVAVDAIIAGVPFHCEDGAAVWLQDKPFTPESRLDFLRRLAWWQWREGEADQTWAFLKATVARETAERAQARAAESNA